MTQANHLRVLELRDRLRVEPAPFVYAQLAEEQRRAGDFDAAVACCRDCLDRYPAYLSVRVILGRALAEQGELTAAAAEFEYVLASAPDNLTATRDLADIELRQGHLERALERFKRALVLFRHDAALEERVRTLTREIESAKPASDGLTQPVEGVPECEPEQTAPPTSPSAVDLDAILVSLGAKDQSLPPMMEMLLASATSKPPSPTPPRQMTVTDLRLADSSSLAAIAELERWLAALQTDRGRGGSSLTGMRIAPPEVFAARSKRLRVHLANLGVDALVVTTLSNIAYITGFFASAGVLLVTPEELILIGDSRYAETLAARAADWPQIRPIVLPAGVSYDAALVDVLEPFRGLRVAFEARQLTVGRHRFITQSLADRGWKDELLSTEGLVEELRVRKDEWEVGRFRDGGERLSGVAKCILPKVLAGRTEAEVAGEIDGLLRRAGFERPAFDTIVASGPNAALPHARAGARGIGDGDLVVLDFGGVLDGYCTDLTRTVVPGRPGGRERELIERVTEAQQAAFALIAAGVAPEMVDGAARDSLASHGLADAFTHGTGHGLGLEIHEAPRVTRVRGDHREPALVAGIVMTLEPGVYFPGWGGVRIEDDVVVTEEGAEWLTDVPRTP